MNQSTNIFSLFALTLFLWVVSYGCKSESGKSNNFDTTVLKKDSIKIESSDSIKPNIDQDGTIIEFTDAFHFQMVKQFIEKIGKHDRVSASAMIGDTSLMIDYYSIEKEGWNITKDHHTRIYFSYASHSYGSVFLEHDSVHVEPYYLGPKDDIDTLIEIILPITKLYNELVEVALQE